MGRCLHVAIVSELDPAPIEEHVNVRRQHQSVVSVKLLVVVRVRPWLDVAGPEVVEIGI
jgi:hypothetical protein